MSDYENDAVDAVQCPFCKSTGVCSHFLLLVDKTFRKADGGVLRAAFNSRWGAVLAETEEDVDEREPFEEILEEVESLSDEVMEYELEGGPGMSSTYVIYFVSSAQNAVSALESFRAGIE